MKRILFFLAVSTAAFSVFAQNDLQQSIPLDPQVRYGKLPNGMTYYVRKNSKPEHRAELRLVVNSGSIMESDSQQGLAHLCEHMAFNGTEHFPKQQLVDYLEQVGMQFGADVNAYTNFDETVYMLQIPTDTEAIFKKGIQMLEDWSHNVSYDSVEIDKERGVVIEEWRLGRGAEDRMERKILPVEFADSRYAVRLTIGQKEIIETAPHDTLKKFYHDWYRPDLEAVVAIGDFDPDQVVSLIKSEFSSIPNPDHERQRILYPVPDQPNLEVVVATDKEAPYTALQILFKQPKEDEKTVADYRTSLVQDLFTSMLQERFLEITEKPNPPFSYAYAYYGSMARTRDVYGNFAVVDQNNVARGLQTVLEENMRVKKFGFAQTELDRMKKQLLVQTQNQYNERDKTESRDYTYEYVNNFLEGSPAPGIEWEYHMQQQLLPAISLSEVNALASKWITDGSNGVISVEAPDKASVSIPSEDQVRSIFTNALHANVKPYIDEVSKQPLLSKMPVPGKITETKSISDFNITEWKLSNGARVILKPTNFKNDEILMSAFHFGGTSVDDDAHFPSAKLCADIINNSGLGSMNSTQLQKYMSDKVANVVPYVNDLQEMLGGNSSVKDFETMMQMAYLYFTAPRKDSSAFSSTLSQMRAAVQNQHASPEQTMSDTVNLVMHNYNGRFSPMDDSWLNKVNLNDAFQSYKQHFAGANGWTFVFVGSFKTDSVKKLIEKYIGGLPSSASSETYRDLNIHAPLGIVEKNIYKGTEPKSYVQIVWNGPFDYNRKNRMDIYALQNLLDIKLRERLREDMSGVYFVQLSPELEKYPKPKYNLTMYFSCSPQNVDTLIHAAFKVIDSVKQFGCAEDDLLKVKETMLKNREVNLRENDFWVSTLIANYSNSEDILGLKDFNSQVQNLTSDDFKKLATQYFNMNNYAKFVLYPEGKPQ